MTAKSRPIPPANRSPKGPGGDKAAPPPGEDKIRPDDAEGRQRNIGQNTTNTGYQQDR